MRRLCDEIIASKDRLIAEFREQLNQKNHEYVRALRDQRTTIGPRAREAILRILFTGPDAYRRKASRARASEGKPHGGVLRDSHGVGQRKTLAQKGETGLFERTGPAKGGWLRQEGSRWCAFAMPLA